MPLTGPHIGWRGIILLAPGNIQDPYVLLMGLWTHKLTSLAKTRNYFENDIPRRKPGKF